MLDRKMNGPRRGRGLFALVIAAVVPLSCAADVEDQDRSCTLIGCGPTARWRLSLDAPFEQIRTSALSVCKNADCTMIPLSGVEEPETRNTGTNVLAAPAGMNVIVWNADPLWELDVEWTAPTPPLMDGDMYVITLTDASGTAIGTISQTVDYHEFYPNGPECEPTCIAAVAR